MSMPQITTAIRGLVVGLSLSAAALAPIASAGTYTTLHIFKGGETGSTPITLAVLNGVVYGVTAYGGGACNGVPTNCGTVFRIEPTTGRYDVLRTFFATESNSTNQIWSLGGKLYVASQFGGKYGYGNLFQFDPQSRQLSTIYDLRGGPNDGSQIESLNLAGNVLYGDTADGGPSTCFALASNNYACGELFAIPLASRKERILYLAANAAGGHSFSGQVVVGNRIYGSALYNKDGSNDDLGTGLLYGLDPATGKKATVYTFKGTADGGNGSFLQFSSGNTVYGYGGIQASPGNVFSLDTATRRERVIHTFKGADGSGPRSLVPGSGASLYGTTGSGGQFGYGTLFKLDARTGALTTLHSFSGKAEGIAPNKIVALGGSIYGVTLQGPLSTNPDGTTNSGFGTIYRYAP